MQNQTSPRFLVCAGSTHEAIDQVRAWGNIFTGNTGFAVARALAAYGPVDLVTSNQQHLQRLAAGGVSAHPITGHGFVSHADLAARMDQLMGEHPDYGAVAMSAAVADYTPAGGFALEEQQQLDDGRQRWTVRPAQAGKISSQHRALALLGTPTEKLVDRFRGQYAFKGMLVKFKLEVDIDEDELLRRGEASRQASGADLLVANTLAMVSGERPGAWLLGDEEPRWLARADLASTLAQRVADCLGISPSPGPVGLVGQLAQWCQQQADLLRQVDEAQYGQAIAGASIGEHIRHCLDHLHALVAGAQNGVIDYEQRRRGWPGERDPALALAELDQLAQKLRTLDGQDLLQAVSVRVLLDPQGSPVELASTWGRELSAMLSHEVHHAAILRGLLQSVGCPLPENYGVAPSTVAYRQGTSCAASA